MRSHLFPLSFPIDVQCHAYERPLKIILAVHGEKLIRILLSRTTTREKRRENVLSLEGQHMARLAKLPLSPTAFEVSGMKEAAVLEFTWLLCLPLGPEDSLRGYPPLSLHLFLPPPSVETLLTKRATIPRSIPPECPRVVFRSLGTTTVTEDVG